jgi:hypothetical protein
MSCHKNYVCIPFPASQTACLSQCKCNLHTLKANSYTPCRNALIHTYHAVPVTLQQCRVLRGSPHGSQKYPNC